MRTLGKAALILLPLAVVGMRLHARAARTPVDVTREVTRCLSIVRVAAARRGGEAPVRNLRERRPRGHGRPSSDSPCI